MTEILYMFLYKKYLKIMIKLSSFWNFINQLFITKKEFHRQYWKEA